MKQFVGVINGFRTYKLRVRFQQGAETAVHISCTLPNTSSSLPSISAFSSFSPGPHEDDECPKVTNRQKAIPRLSVTASCYTGSNSRILTYVRIVPWLGDDPGWAIEWLKEGSAEKKGYGPLVCTLRNFPFLCSDSLLQVHLFSYHLVFC
jgi:hypothetical protein